MTFGGQVQPELGPAFPQRCAIRSFGLFVTVDGVGAVGFEDDCASCFFAYSVEPGRDGFGCSLLGRVSIGELVYRSGDEQIWFDGQENLQQPLTVVTAEEVQAFWADLPVQAGNRLVASCGESQWRSEERRVGKECRS